ncbi:MAG TPA: Hsp70 family protein, partial [Methylomirabilota bacterium]|nr:Hsp70 family protein [Methylomirabilota bacterium]
CQESLQMAGLGIADIDDVILVGGTTKIPYVRDQVSRFFERAPRTDVNPEDAVAVGAALQANSLERILSRPRTSSRQVPIRRPSESMDSLDSFTDPDAHVPAALELAQELDEITFAQPAPTAEEPNVARPKRETSGYAEQRPAAGRVETGYSIKKPGARDHYAGRSESEVSDDLDTKPGVVDPYDQRVPNAQPLARLTPAKPDPKKTAFGVPAGPPPLPRPTGRRPGAPQRPTPPADAASTIPPSGFDLGLELGSGGPSLDVGGVKFELEETPAAVQPPPRPRPSPAATPLAATLVLAPDFANEVDTTEALALAEKMAAEASAASTAKGMGAARTTLAAAPMPPQPLPRGAGMPPAALPTMVAQVPVSPIAPAYADDPRRGPPAPLPAPPPVPPAFSPPGPARPIPTILEVTPRGLGIATVAGFCEELIRRNERLPATEHKSFTTARDMQAIVRIVVCQGESRRLDNNTVIGDLVLANLPPRPRGETTIEVTFVIDASGILQVSARDQATGAEQRASLDLVGAVSQQDVAASRERLQQLRR